jgi:hypothetical protein
MDYLGKYDFNYATISFTSHLEKLFDDSKKKKSEVIRSIDITRSYAYEIFSGQKKPSRDKVIMLCFGLCVDYQEAQRLLSMAKHNPLHPKDKRDSIIIYGLYNQLSFYQINLLLNDFEEVLLG